MPDDFPGLAIYRNDSKLMETASALLLPTKRVVVVICLVDALALSPLESTAHCLGCSRLGRGVGVWVVWCF